MSLRFVSAKNESEKKQTLELLQSSHLLYDEKVSETYNMYDDDELVGTISTYENVIKMIAVTENRQGEQMTNHLLHHVMRIFESRQINKYFLYTKPQNKHIFLHNNFSFILETDEVTLFENNIYPIKDHLLALKLSLKPRHGKKACIVMNCNPITNGHLYLIETCAKEVDDVIVFLVEENKSVFPFDVRFKLVKQATKHLKNVHVLPSTPYIISRATFPTYFLKETSIISQIFMDLDVILFRDYFFPIFEFDYRYVGTEPKDMMTAQYNETMKRIFGHKLVVIERKTYNEDAISASFVRSLMKKKDYHSIKSLVPKTTYKFLLSKEGRALFHE